LTEARDGDSSRVVVDLSRLTFIDSTGIAFLVAAVKEDEERRLSFIPCKAYAVERVLSVTGVDEMLDGAARDVDAAVIERERERP
jgi:anti-anti-sigma factor